MLAVPVMVTSSSGGLETVCTLGIRNIDGDDRISDYEVTLDGVIVANVESFERDRGALALVGEAVAAIERREVDITYITRQPKGKHGHH